MSRNKTALDFSSNMSSSNSGSDKHAFKKRSASDDGIVSTNGAGAMVSERHQNRHAVHCVVPKTDDAFETDRQNYTEHVMALVNPPPGPTYTKNIRMSFKKDKRKKRRLKLILVNPVPGQSTEDPKKDGEGWVVSLDLALALTNEQYGDLLGAITKIPEFFKTSNQKEDERLSILTQISNKIHDNVINILEKLAKSDQIKEDKDASTAVVDKCQGPHLSVSDLTSVFEMYFNPRFSKTDKLTTDIRELREVLREIPSKDILVNLEKYDNSIALILSTVQDVQSYVKEHLPLKEKVPSQCAECDPNKKEEEKEEKPEKEGPDPNKKGEDEEGNVPDKKGENEQGKIPDKKGGNEEKTVPDKKETEDGSNPDKNEGEKEKDTDMGEGENEVGQPQQQAEKEITRQPPEEGNELRRMLEDVINRLDDLQKLVKDMQEQQQPPVYCQPGVSHLNLPHITPGRSDFRHKSLFEAAREKDPESFVQILKAPEGSGVSNDVSEPDQGDRTIVHELIYLSKEVNSKLHWPKSVIFDQDKALLTMLKSLYDPDNIIDWRKNMKQRPPSLTAGPLVNGHRLSRDLEVDALKTLLSIRNKAQYTALQFAATCSTKEMITILLNNPPYLVESKGFLQENEQSYDCFVTNEIDPILNQKGGSVLDLCVTRDPKLSAAILNEEPLRTLVEDKWRYYQWYYWLAFILYILFMIIYTLCALNRPIGATSFDEMTDSTEDILRFVGEILVLLLLLPMLLYGEIRDYIGGAWIRPWPQDRHGLFRIINLVFVLLTLLVFIFRVRFNPTEDIFLSLALLLGWTNSIQFLAAWKKGGMFPLIMHYAFVEDLIQRFLLVFLLVLTAFSTATYCAYQDGRPSDPEDLADFPASKFLWYPFSLFKLSFGAIEADYATESRVSILGVILYIAYIWLGTILLFNLLVGMLTDTYSRYRQLLEESWVWVIASYALLMERRVLGCRFTPYQSVTGDVTTTCCVSSGSSCRMRGLYRKTGGVGNDPVQYFILIEKLPAVAYEVNEEAVDIGRVHDRVLRKCNHGQNFEKSVS